MQRRAFLKLATGTIAAALVGPRALYAAEGGALLYASCVKLPDETYAVAILEENGTIRQLRPLPDRGHDVAFDPVSRRCVAFARRPGTFAVVFDLDGQREPVTLASAPGRHFYGHGVFSADGGILYATENDYERGAGVIGLYDARDGFARIGEFQTGGVGPHELVWLPDRRTLAIANGGLDTHPEFGRVNLNTAEMAPSLVLMEASSGRLQASHTLGPELSALSIRHLAVDAAGAVWFGCQFEGDPTDLPPLVGRVAEGGSPELFDLPLKIINGTRNYIGSVAASADAEQVIFSAPKGNMVFAFDARSAAFLGHAALVDGCGVAPGPGAGFLATSGRGDVGAIAAADFRLRPVKRDEVAFDNHLNRLA